MHFLSCNMIGACSIIFKYGIILKNRAFGRAPALPVFP
ncbi:UNVERIFIED_ORG: hypothetical protein QOE_1692 [Clostridioides difficile F501]